MYKRALIASLALTLIGCVGEPTGSSSSETASSAPIAASSSQGAISSMSSTLSSSSQVTTSSSSDRSSQSVISSIASSSASANSSASAGLSCDSVVEQGQALYASKNCTTCHGPVGANGVTNGAGSLGGTINPLDSTFGTPGTPGHGDPLGLYISKAMAIYTAVVGGCDVACGNAIEAYLTDLAGEPSCSNDGPSSSSVSSASSSSSLPVSADAVVVPARIESEDFINAFDTTPENKGTCGDANQSVDFQPKAAGGGNCDVNWTDPGEWLDYKIHLASQKSLDFYVSLASANAGKTVTLLIDGQTLGSAEAPSAGWTTFESKKVATRTLAAGEYIVRVSINTGGLNIDAIDVRNAGDEPPYTPTQAELDEGFDTWTSNCDTCHGDRGQGTLTHPYPINMAIYPRSRLIEKIFTTMPPKLLPEDDPKVMCDLTCSQNVADFMIAGYPGVFDKPELGCSANPLNQHGNTPIRLLTTGQFSRHIASVFAPLNLNMSALVEPGTFIDDDNANGFVTNTGVTASLANVEKMVKLAETIGQRAGNNFSRLMTCGINQNCVSNYIREYGEKLYRQPLNNTQVNELTALFSANPNATGIGHVTAAMLLAGSTLYHYETAVANRQLLKPRELAERMAFLIWGMPADKALLDKAASGALNAEAGIRAEAQAMLQDPRAVEGLKVFYSDYLDIPSNYRVVGNDSAGGGAVPAGECTSSAQCRGLYQEKTGTAAEAIDCMVGAGGICYCGNGPCAQLGGGMAESGADFSVTAKEITDEITRFTNYLTRDVNGTFQDLLTSRKAFVDETMAKIYGVPSGQLSGAREYLGGKEVELAASERAGLLTRAAFVITGSGKKVGLTSPTQRGEFVRKHILCQEPPAVPGDVPFPAIPDPTKTTWVQTLKDIHLKDNDDNPATPNPCVACHESIDPIGFSFENYTLNGQFITSYPNGLPVDSSGYLVALDSGERDFDGAQFGDAIEFSEMLASSHDAAACFAESWMSYALARTIVDSAPDSCAAEKLVEQFEADNYSLSGLITAIVTNPSFRYRNPE